MSMQSSGSGAYETRLARPADTHQLSLTLARAFHYDPVQCWLFPDESARARKCQRLFAVFLRSLIPRETVFTTTGLEGTALWVAPEHVKPSLLKQVELGMQILPILGSSIPRGIQWWLALGRRQPQYPHWYLFALGTAPEHQRKGIGSALLRPILQKCDIERVAAYLEAGSEENVSFYQGRGFEILGEIELPRGPTIYQLVREPVGRCMGGDCDEREYSEKPLYAYSPYTADCSRTSHCSR